MAEIRKWMQAHLPTRRRLVQVYAALLYNAHLRGFAAGEIYTGGTKVMCTPGLNCYSCPGAVGACPLGALQNALASAGTRTGTYVLGILLLYGLLLGRTICGWLCPVGLIQELLHRLPTPKLKKSRFTRALSYLKYVILAVFVLAIPLWVGLAQGIPVPAFCKYICPAGTLEGAVGLLSNPGNDSLYGMLGLLFTRKTVIMAVIGLACVFCYRAFCRFLCPLGAIYGLFNRISLIGVRVELPRCNGCGACVRACPMDVRHVGDHECIHCGKCMSACAQQAISLRAGGKTLLAPAGEEPTTARRTLGRVVWGIALAILVFALLWFNVLDPALAQKTAAAAQTAAPAAQTALPDATPVAAPAAEVPEGYEVGQRLPEFTADLVGGGVFDLAAYRGKVVFLNLWATYCTPCVQELPYFNELYHAWPDDLAMLAVHASLVTEDVEAYLAARDWDFDFAIDTEDDRLVHLVGGSALLPQTLVLNREGVVVYNQVGSITYDKLQRLYELANGTSTEEASAAEATAEASPSPTPQRTTTTRRQNGR